ncbi:MAG TPA: diguanylate cyclase [Candidatus Saccharimonadales bacterium]|jgi:diguanylate cyclase (GGDEF)-like protein/PAS domain S-box-containing protein|nr:diguanylate cyclase [Candidatus Saccharimonadales bacterium]
MQINVQAALASRTNCATSRRRILVVEDEQRVALDLAGTLEELGYTVYSAGSGEAAIEQALTISPDLVLMDIRLGGKINGLQAGQAIRSRLNVPIVYHSAHTDGPSIDSAKQIGNFEYLVRPFNASDLQCALDVALHQHQMEALLAQSEERYRSLVENSIALIGTHDLDGNILFINGAAAGALGYAPDECIGKNIRSVLARRGHADFDSYLKKVQNDLVVTGHAQLLGRNGEQRVFFFSNRLMRHAGGGLYVLAHAQDITKMVEMQKTLHKVQRTALQAERKLARTDPLTGLANRRAFFEATDIESKRAARYSRPFTAVYLDLDNFKQINDQHGHQTGDQVLICVADVLRKKTRTECIAARVGGDEFALLLPEAGQSAAEHAASNLHECLTAAMREKNWRITFSIGVMTFATPPESAEQVVRLADELMYTMKHAGKNGIAASVMARESGIGA